MQRPTIGIDSKADLICAYTKRVHDTVLLLDGETRDTNCYHWKELFFLDFEC